MIIPTVKKFWTLIIVASEIIVRETNHRTGNKLLDIDGNCIKDHRTGSKLLDIDGNYIRDHRTGSKLFDIDGTYVKDHRTGKRLYDFNGYTLLSYPYMFAVLHALDVF